MAAVSQDQRGLLQASLRRGYRTLGRAQAVQGKILGCRALVVLHDQEGHPLLVTTHRGDQHLTMGLPAIITGYEQAVGLHSVERVVVDHKGMAAGFLAALAGEGRTVVTVLRTDRNS